MVNERMRAVIKELQDAMVVMAHMEGRQIDRLLRQEKEIEELTLSRVRVDQTVLRLQVGICSLSAAHEQNTRGDPTS